MEKTDRKTGDSPRGRNTGNAGNAGNAENTGNTEGSLNRRLSKARKELYRKLTAIDLRQLGISDYNRRYLGDKITHGVAFLKIYSDLIRRAIAPLAGGSISPEKFVLVDYGGGNGLLSLLAREAGIGTVIYNDIYDVSCRDMEILSEALDLQPDHIHCGDADDLVHDLRQKEIPVDALVSFDVLEHIYDVEKHFRTLTALPGSFRVVYASGANLYNPWYLKWVTPKQQEAEYQNREKREGHKERDTLRSYLEIRREIISSFAPELNSDQVEELARATRGLMKPDIEQVVQEYLWTGTIHYHPDHPTNTCDPWTGNWCEHLIDHDWLEKTLSKAGYRVRILPGTNQFGSASKRLMKFFLNPMIRLLDKRAMFMAPHYIVCAEHSSAAE